MNEDIKYFHDKLMAELQKELDLVGDGIVPHWNKAYQQYRLMCQTEE